MHKRASAGAKLAQVLGQDASTERMGAVGGNLASGFFSSALQQSLSSFGTARVRLNLSSAQLDGSEFDFLLPLSENHNNLFFTQTGIRRIDDRTMANVGLGYRIWPTDSMMLGSNLFYDYDISRKHKRLGAGLEYARDFFRLSTNGYFRLSDWKSSPDFADYHERVANGFDIRTEAWLPALPQLGGKLAWTRFYGDQVGIFGPDDLQKDPQLLTVGVDYTPVPLAGVSLQKTINTRGGHDEFSVALNLSWQLGLPLKTQLDPERVRFNRTLAGSRYDLVDRNNVIVLEYKKDRLFSVPAKQRVAGTENARLALNLDITSRYTVTGISWQGSDYFAAGGDVVFENNGYVLVLPEWRETAANRYQLEGRAIDAKGNLSPAFNIEIDVLAMDIKISLAGDLKGEEGQSLPLGLNARTEKAIGKVEWDAPEFLAAGGKFVQTRTAQSDGYSLNYNAVLPPYQPDGKNEYALRVKVTDSEGNVSNTAEAKIVVEPRSVVLTLPPTISGNEGERIKLPLKVDAKTAITSLDWEAPDFIARGGSISVENDTVWLTLPAWSQNSVNEFAITLTATDDQNHRSASVTTQVSVSSASISFTLEDSVAGVSGEEITLSPQASAQAGIDRIEWQADAFFSAGGKVTSNGKNGYSLSLPLWKKDSDNRYTLRATAWDTQGRSSATLSMTVEVRPAVITVTAPQTLEGTELATLEATMSVASENTTVSELHFSAEAFFAAGGKVTGSVPNYHVILPAWQADGSNRYAILVTGKDAQGNASEPVTVEVTVSQAPLTLSAESGVTGVEGSTAVVTPTVESLYGIARYEIEAPAFKSAGGAVEQKDGVFHLTLPGYEIGGENRYPVTVRAVDKKGMVSAPLELNVVVTTRLLNTSGQCSVVGGGSGYEGQIDKASVDYQEARDYATLKALTDSGARYIYIPGDAEIEIPMVQSALFVKSGTTIFSDRGINGSEGARLNVSYIDEQVYKFPVIVMDSNTRMSGIRYEGPYKGTTTENTTIGIQTVSGSKNIEVDNMEMWGWPWAAVSVKNTANVRVHHSFIHSNIKSGLGYGVVTQNGNATAEIACNVFDSNRHAIAGSGQSGEGYAAHHNLVLNNGERGAYHQFDMHMFAAQNIAGAFMDITQNWFDFGRYGTSNRSSIGVRGQPERGPITVTDNWFSQDWVVGSQRAVAGEYGTWVPTEESILATNQFNVSMDYLNKGNQQCVIDWLSYSQSVNCYSVNR
ncbi:hypothetical protein GWD52_00850 [Enterobacteriaceae bacterium 4M9]|nr:hypothetical protein [Enterobacteriaceae bacterium 4M9]